MPEIASTNPYITAFQRYQDHPYAYFSGIVEYVIKEPKFTEAEKVKKIDLALEALNTVTQR